MGEWDSNEKILERVLHCLKKFDPTKEHFIKWQEYVEQMLNMFKIKNNRRSHILLNILESSVLTYVRSHVEPDDPFNIPYEMLISILEEKYSPYGVFQSAAYRFTFRDQMRGESIENYYCTLKKLMNNYDNGPKAKSNLRFRFIYGLQNAELRKKLLKMPTITTYRTILAAMKTEFIENSSVMNHIDDKWFHLLQELKKEEERARKARIMSGQDSDLVTLEKVLFCLKKFDPKTLHFLLWHDLVKYCFDILEINKNKRSYFLLNILEPSVLAYVKSHVEPDDPFSIPYEMLIGILQEKYYPYGEFQSVMFRFTFRDQFIGESLEHYYYSLKKLNEKLDISSTAKSNLLFRFKFGLEDNEIRKALLETPNLTMYNAMVIAMKTEFNKKSSLKNLFEDQWFYLMHELKTEEEQESLLKNQL